MTTNESLAGAVRIFFQSEAGKELMDRLKVTHFNLLESASKADKEEAFALLKEAKGVQTSISVLKTVMSLDKTKKGGRVS